MRGIVCFNSKHLCMYYIARSAVIFLSVLLYAFSTALNSVLENFFKDIVTKWFLKLLTLIYIIFFQGSIFLRQKYPKHLLFDYCLFFLSKYRVFTEEILANLVYKNTN